MHGRAGAPAGHPDLRVADSGTRAPDLLPGPYGSGPTGAVAGTTTRLAWNHRGTRVPSADNLVTVLAQADTSSRPPRGSGQRAKVAVEVEDALSGADGQRQRLRAETISECFGLSTLPRRVNVPLFPKKFEIFRLFPRNSKVSTGKTHWPPNPMEITNGRSTYQL